jgi:cyclophilin family peptidyl-prolyl cis-trans isomerase
MRIGFLLLAPALLLAVPAEAAPEARIETTLGTIVVALDAEKAPATVANFIRYAREGHYDGTVFYRVVPGFVLQAGSYRAGGVYKPTQHAPIPLETANGLSNLRGTIAMAREDKPQSATSEFFINLDDVNARGLDPKPAAAPGTTGYAVFGHVTEGLDVVDKIAAVRLGGGKGPFPDFEPMTPVVILKVTIDETVSAPPPLPNDALSTPAPQTPGLQTPSPAAPSPQVPGPESASPQTPSPQTPSPQ